MRELHGETGTRLYNIWKGMKNRCKSRSLYTDKEITVCKEWSYSYTSFRDWALAEGYSDELSIDRINNNGNYEPSNCRWTNQLTQSANTRTVYSHNKSGYRGVSWNKQYGKWEVSISVKSKSIKIGYYDSAIDAARAYDTYLKDNNLPHTSNGTTKRIESNTGKVLIATNTSGYVGVTSPKRIQHLSKPWSAQVSKNKTRLFDGYFTTALQAAIARERFIVSNNLTNKRNFTDEQLEQFNADEKDYYDSVL